MDAKCVRVLRVSPSMDAGKRAIYIDEDARYSLMVQWGDLVRVSGRRLAKEVEVQPLDAMDQGGFIARVPESLLDELYVEYGEEVMMTRG